MLGIGKSEKISDEMSLFASRLILCRSKGEIARLTGEFMQAQMDLVRFDV